MGIQRVSDPVMICCSPDFHVGDSLHLYPLHSRKEWSRVTHWGMRGDTLKSSRVNGRQTAENLENSKFFT
jgi:hypothetical protein